jgi:hypothetical protein
MPGRIFGTACPRTRANPALLGSRRPDAPQLVGEYSTPPPRSDNPAAAPPGARSTGPFGNTHPT